MPSGDHAVVMGAGFAGLLAARVLADHYGAVTIVERDEPPASDRPRRFAPQGAHLHILLRSGVDVLARLFPGIEQAMVDDGIERMDAHGDVAWHQYGMWRARRASSLFIYPQSRAALEARVHALVGATANVAFRHGARACGLVLEDDRIRAVRLAGEDEPGDELLEADLVVDCTGRGSHVFEWLADAGHPEPAESRIHMNLRYATQLFTPPRSRADDWKALFVTGTPPTVKRGGAILPLEGGRWMATVAAYFDDEPPSDSSEMLEFTRGFVDPAYHRALASAEACSGVEGYRFPFNRRRHVERLDRFPDGLLVLGDAVASFDPAYGQGMSVAALEAEALGTCLAAGLRDGGLWREAFARIGRIVDRPWTLVAVEAFRFAQTLGERPFGIGAAQRWGDLAIRASHDPDVALQLVRITQLLDPPSAVLRPAFAGKVLRHGATTWLSRS